MGCNREGLLLAGQPAVAAEDDGAAALVLVQQRAAGEVVDEAALALDARVADVAHLLAVELLPLLCMEALVERWNVLWQHLHIQASLMHCLTHMLQRLAILGVLTFWQGTSLMARQQMSWWHPSMSGFASSTW